MIAEIICVGSELLMGQIVNTNARYISRKLSELGVSLYFESVVGDNIIRLQEQLRLSCDRCDIVILTGGLGPTQDDLTKWAVADVLGVKMIEDAASREKIEEMFKKRKLKGQITANNYRQAQFPEGSIILENTVGTAPGCIVEGKTCTYVLLPGPPFELKNMFEKTVYPYLMKKSDAKIESRYIKVFGIGESMLETMLGDIIDKQTNPSIAMYASGQVITLRLTSRVKKGESASAILDKSADEIREILGEAIFSQNDENLEEVVLKQLIKRGETLSITESLTGGMLSSMIVSVPGASKVLKESIVSYSIEAKIRLGVEKEIIKKYGAVSSQCAEAMAKAIMERSGSDWAISTTGVAGPGDDEFGNEEGKYFCCIMNKDGFTTIERVVGGERERIRRFSCLSALNQLRLDLGR